MRQSIRTFDRTIQTLVDKLPRRLGSAMLFFTLIGQPPFTVGIAAVTFGYGWALGLSHYQWAGVTAVGTIIIVSLLKLVLRRPRPSNDYVRHMLIQTFSFPSGHAAGALVSYGLVATIVAYLWPAFAIPVWVGALVITFFISLSRVYLKAHYASDIIGGWLVGSVGLALIVIEFLALNGNS